MFKTIAVPVDLAHKEALTKALGAARDLAKANSAELHLIGVTTETPGPLAHSPKEFGDKLQGFADELGRDFGLTVRSHPVISQDLKIDLDRDIMQACDAVGADLVVMASHVPGLADYIFSSNAGYLASHAKISVFVVR